MALFLPLAAWLIASRRGEWNQLLAATVITVLIAIPVLVALRDRRGLRLAPYPRGDVAERPAYTRHVGPLSDGYIRLVHWNEEEAPERAARLERLGYEVEATVPGTSIGIRELSANPPAAFVIDLSRLPSHGREVARAVRQSKALRAVPILFLDGKPEKVAAGRGRVPRRLLRLLGGGRHRARGGDLPSARRPGRAGLRPRGLTPDVPLAEEARDQAGLDRRPPRRARWLRADPRRAARGRGA